MDEVEPRVGPTRLTASQMLPEDHKCKESVTENIRIQLSFKTQQNSESVGL